MLVASLSSPFVFSTRISFSLNHFASEWKRIKAPLTQLLPSASSLCSSLLSGPGLRENPPLCLQAAVTLRHKEQRSAAAPSDDVNMRHDGNSWGLMKLLLSDHSLTLALISTLILHTFTCWSRSWSGVGLSLSRLLSLTLSIMYGFRLTHYFIYCPTSEILSQWHDEK